MAGAGVQRRVERQPKPRHNRLAGRAGSVLKFVKFRVTVSENAEAPGCPRAVERRY